MAWRGVAWPLVRHACAGNGLQGVSSALTHAQAMSCGCTCGVLVIVFLFNMHGERCDTRGGFGLALLASYMCCSLLAGSLDA